MPTPKKQLAESEVKIKIHNSEFATLPKILKRNNFRIKNTEKITDYLLNKKESKLGGWNFIRLRNINDKKFLHTAKEWGLDKDGNKVRLEDEKCLSKNRFLSLSKNSKFFIKKYRHNYKGFISKLPAIISVDELNIKNKSYYFIECEIITTVGKSHQTRKKIITWMNTNLHLKNKTEAPSMLDFIESLD